MEHEVFVASAEEATAYCLKLIADGSADLFRGQSNDWPSITPSLFRGSDEAKNQARVVLGEFTEWANTVPQMATYHNNDQAITAIAQHYGIPTSFLDLTIDPLIAELFARGTIDSDSAPENAVIYCFKRENLVGLKGFKVLEIDVINLWRLQAQRGLFLEYTDDCIVDQVRASAICVHFPRKPITKQETVSLYPLRKSLLETVIDQWTYRHKVQQLFAQISIPRVLMIRRYTYPGIFRWRHVPEFEPDWIEYDPRWIFPKSEHVSLATKSEIYTVGLDDALDVKKAFERLMAQFKKPIETYAANGIPIGFAFEFPTQQKGYEQSASIVLNRCWDGIRAHPYGIESSIRCMAATAMAIIRAVLHPDSEEWEGRLWGKTEAIDVAPVGGQIDSGGVSSATLYKSRNSKHDHALTKYARRKVTENPAYLFDYVVDPWILFDFIDLSTMMVEQFIPSSIGLFWKEAMENGYDADSQFWGLSFNAALLAAVTRFNWRFVSPVSMERDVERVILISKDMDEDEIEEIFISCLPCIFKEQKPFVINFTDYSKDKREVWEIERVIEQCKVVNKIGGISVLDVFPGQFDQTATEDGPSGLGAFHIWAIANGILVGGTSGIEVTKPLFERFMTDLLISNKNLEGRARAEPDWPESV